MIDDDKIYYYYEAIKNVSEELKLTDEEKEILRVIIKSAYDRQVKETEDAD